MTTITITLLDVVVSPFTYLILQFIAIIYLWLRKPQVEEDHPSQALFNALDLRVATQSRNQNNFRTDLETLTDSMHKLNKICTDIEDVVEAFHKNGPERVEIIHGMISEQIAGTGYYERIEKLETRLNVLTKALEPLTGIVINDPNEESHDASRGNMNDRTIGQDEPLTTAELASIEREPNEDSSGE